MRSLLKIHKEFIRFICWLWHYHSLDFYASVLFNKLNVETVSHYVGSFCLLNILLWRLPNTASCTLYPELLWTSWCILSTAIGEEHPDYLLSGSEIQPSTVWPLWVKGVAGFPVSLHFCYGDECHTVRSTIVISKLSLLPWDFLWGNPALYELSVCTIALYSHVM